MIEGMGLLAHDRTMAECDRCDAVAPAMGAIAALPCRFCGVTLAACEPCGGAAVALAYRAAHEASCGARWAPYERPSP